MKKLETLPGHPHIGKTSQERRKRRKMREWRHGKKEKENTHRYIQEQRKREGRLSKGGLINRPNRPVINLQDSPQPHLTSYSFF